jgi:peptidyl-prolyl cis-trans isomerase SurA
LNQIKAGTSFSELAKKNSDDPGSASHGGELGFFSRGDFVSEFEQVAFSLQPGQISEVVETKFGFHVIQMIERRGEKINVRQILITLRPTDEDRGAVIDTLKGIRDKAIRGANWADLATKYSEDPEVKENKGHLGEFEAGSLKINEFKEVIDHLQLGDISEPFHTDYGYHILKLNDRQTARPLALDKDWQKVENIALNYKQTQEFRKWLEELRKDMYIDIKK